tara:strand:+ start:27 stop:176 length:150 start_codon:yes stop_codon:yes gene_type:complete
MMGLKESKIWKKLVDKLTLLLVLNLIGSLVALMLIYESTTILVGLLRGG